MKLKETNWTSVRIGGRTIMKRDLLFMSGEQRKALDELDVEKITAARQKGNHGRYKAVEKQKD